MTKFENWMLKRICKRIVKHDHNSNIIEYYRVMNCAVKNEFTENNEITLQTFLQECFGKSFLS